MVQRRRKRATRKTTTKRGTESRQQSSASADAKDPLVPSVQEMSNDLVYLTASLYVGKRIGARQVHQQLRSHFAEECRRFEITDQKIVAVVREAIRRQYVRFEPPEDEEQARRLKAKSTAKDDLNKEVYTVNLREPEQNPRTKSERKAAVEYAEFINEQLANTAAGLLVTLIRSIGSKKRGKEHDRVHIGLGAGKTTMMVIRRLGQRLQREFKFPKLTLHALTSGFSLNPHEAPVTYFQFFERNPDKIEPVGLFCNPFVQAEDYNRFRGEKWIAMAFERVQELDIVVTSLATADDPHGLVNQVLDQDQNGTTQQALRARDWRGDVQFNPFGKDGPLVLETGVRAVTLVDIPHLCKMSEPDSGRAVVLVSGYCTTCAKSKASALAPLVQSPHLKLWTHLVTDISSAARVLNGNFRGRINDLRATKSKASTT